MISTNLQSSKLVQEISNIQANPTSKDYVTMYELRSNFLQKISNHQSAWVQSMFLGLHPRRQAHPGYLKTSKKPWDVQLSQVRLGQNKLWPKCYLMWSQFSALKPCLDGAKSSSFMYKQKAKATLRFLPQRGSSARNKEGLYAWRKAVSQPMHGRFSQSQPSPALKFTTSRASCNKSSIALLQGRRCLWRWKRLDIRLVYFLWPWSQFSEWLLRWKADFLE